jgi:hypothetical protein
VQNGDQVYLQWPAVEEPDVVGYVIREGSTYEAGMLIATGVTDPKYSVPVTTETLRTYHVKAINRSGHLSLQAASAQVRIENLPPHNVAFEFDELLQHSGTFDKTQYTMSEYRAISQGWRCNDPVYGELRANELGGSDVIKLAEETPGQFYTSGAYIGPVHDLGALTTAFVAVEWRNTALLSSATACVLQVRTSNDNVTWTEWSDFVPAERTFRYIQFRVLFATTNPNESAEIVEWVDSIDVPDVTDQAHGVTVPAGGLAVTFGRRFYAIPTVTATCHYAGAPKFACIEGASTAGFTVRVFDLAGNDVGGTIDWIAKGY